MRVDDSALVRLASVGNIPDPLLHRSASEADQANRRRHNSLVSCSWQDAATFEISLEMHKMHLCRCGASPRPLTMGPEAPPFVVLCATIAIDFTLPRFAGTIAEYGALVSPTALSQSVAAAGGAFVPKANESASPFACHGSFGSGRALQPLVWPVFISPAPRMHSCRPQTSRSASHNQPLGH